MSKNNTSKFVCTILCSGLAIAINYLISMALTPYITKTMGTDAYGFISLAKTFSQYAIIFTAGLNSYAARFISLAHHKGNENDEKKYFNSVFFANVFLSTVILFISIFIIIFLDNLINIPPELISQVKILFLFNFVNYLVLSTGTCFSVYGHIQNKLAVVNLVKIFAYITEALALVLMFLVFPAKLYYVGLALLLSSVCIFSCDALICKKELPVLKINYKYFSLSAVKELLISGIWNSINSLGNILNTGLDLLITNIMLTATAMGQLSIVKTLSTIFVTLFQTIATPWQPILLKKYSSKDIDGTVLSFKHSIKITAFFSNILFAGLFVYGIPYFRLWTPEQNENLLYKLLVITLLGMLIEGPIYPLLYTYTLTLKNVIPCFVTIGSGLLNIVGMYLMLKYTSMGVYAIVLTTSVLAWLVYFVFTPLYTSYCLNIKWYTFYPTLLRVLIAGLACVGTCSVVNLVYTPNTWISLILSAFVCVILCVPIYALMVISKSEFKTAIAKIVKRRNAI